MVVPDEPEVVWLVPCMVPPSVACVPSAPAEPTLDILASISSKKDMNFSSSTAPIGF